MVIHDKYIGLINAELDGDITRVERKELKAHLAECEVCAAERENLRSVTRAFGDAERLRVPAGFNAAVLSALREAGALQTAPSKVGPMWRWLGVAAAVAGILPMLGATLLVGQPVLQVLRDSVIWCVKAVSDTVLESAILLKASSALSEGGAALGGVIWNLTDYFAGQALVTHGILVACVALAIGGYMLLSRRRQAASQMTI